MESVNKPFEARLKALAGSISTQYKRLHTHTHTHTHTGCLWGKMLVYPVTAEQTWNRQG
jgi:hypothetical protein